VQVLEHQHERLGAVRVSIASTSSSSMRVREAGAAAVVPVASHGIAATQLGAARRSSASTSARAGSRQRRLNASSTGR
jgi:hypothetical protein